MNRTPAAVSRSSFTWQRQRQRQHQMRCRRHRDDVNRITISHHSVLHLVSSNARYRPNSSRSQQWASPTLILHPKQPLTKATQNYTSRHFSATQTLHKIVSDAPLPPFSHDTSITHIASVPACSCKAKFKPQHLLSKPTSTPPLPSGPYTASHKTCLPIIHAFVYIGSRSLAN
ncbi:hypothetical protein T440DRAFT_110233 [Plenodomus tracheiphilus IPT5]|uniref:Uncharacterized protein n=1 Tax=Plenodomus tracheiphilus IPT5 TaxID=1408161 RepID=A0A6A7B4E3_9PLEO|nr:hypothetical protein T440DRAFT_110233 [Plenodomus tracheiphilus IPT5]